jgi:hypothetical protein
MWLAVTKWLTVTALTSEIHVDEKVVLSSVRPVHSQLLHSLILMWGKQNFTQGIFNYPREEYDGKQ